MWKRIGEIFCTPFFGQSALWILVSVSRDSTNCRWKIFGGKIPKCFKKKNLNLPHSGNYLPSIYIVLGFIDYLDIFKVYRRMCVGYMRILHHFIEDMSILGFWYQRGVLGPWATAIRSLWNPRWFLHLSLNSGLTHFKDSMTSGCHIEQHRYGRMHCNLPVFLMVS